MNENEIPLSPNRSQGLTELPSKPDLYENSNHGSPVVQSSSPGVFKPRQQLKMTDRSKMKNRICRQSSEDNQEHYISFQNKIYYIHYRVTHKR